MQVVATIKAHEKNLRAMDYDKGQDSLVTGSFDRNLQLYRDC